ncbi:6-phosphogluconate dehydrogenase [Aspergillus multicolor]|uniref:6-phosphogluconate dehydrogenase n=1 Tax=Aspergillus multicolor TaxID=41759 RepID=UPI003CCD75AE
MWGANAGTLSFMVGHLEPTESDIVGKRIFDTLSMVGVPSTTTFCGGLGMSQVVKIPHDYITLANNLVATDGMAIGLKYGIDQKALFKRITEGTASSWVMGLEQPVPDLVPDAPSSNKYKRAFAPALSVKDLTIAINSAKRKGIKPTAGEAAVKAFKEVDADPRTHVCLRRSFRIGSGILTSVRTLTIPCCGCMCLATWMSGQRRIWRRGQSTSCSLEFMVLLAASHEVSQWFAPFAKVAPVL